MGRLEVLSGTEPPFTARAQSGGGSKFTSLTITPSASGHICSTVAMVTPLTPGTWSLATHCSAAQGPSGALSFLPVHRTWRVHQSMHTSDGCSGMIYRNGSLCIYVHTRYIMTACVHRCGECVYIHACCTFRFVCTYISSDCSM